MFKIIFKKIYELISDKDGSLSHTKLWSNIANGIASGSVINTSINGTLTPELLGVFLAGVGLQRLGSKYLDTETKDTTQETTTTNQNIEEK
jgi:hypothetical protein